MDSSGLGTIVKLYVSGRTSGCTVSLINFNRRVRELLGMTNLLRIFESCADHTARMP
jgi:anti-sigma B factor antagonist